MFFRTATAAFVLAEGASSSPDRVGLGDVREIDGFLLGEWPGIGATWYRDQAIDGGVLVELFYRRSAVLDAGPEELDPLDGAFVAACQAARGAWIDHAPHYEDERWSDRLGSGDRNRRLAALVVASDPDALVAERLTAVWLDATLASIWDGIVDDDAEVREVGDARLIFTRSGAKRWI